MTSLSIGRGRHATSPFQMPAKGWKDVLVRVKNKVSDDRISMVSAAMSYYALFALVPALSSIVLIYTWVSNPADISEHLSRVSQILPKDLTNVLETQLGSLASTASAKLGFSALMTLAFSLWSSSKGSQAIMDALNIIYAENESRHFIKKTLVAIGLSFLGALLAIVAMGVVVIFPAIAQFLNFGQEFESLIGLASWVALIFLFSLFLSAVYRYAPDRRVPKWKWVSAGSVIASVLWIAVSLGFSFYAANFGNFDKTYGSLGAIVVVMTWFYLTSFVILLGGEINAELEHQTIMDTTKGFAKPLGVRGAMMADTIGAATGVENLSEKMSKGWTKLARRIKKTFKR